MKKILFFIFIILAALIFVLPYVASMSPCKDMLLEHFGRKLHGRLSIEKVSLSWLGPQDLTGIEFVETEGIQFTVKKATISAPLWKIFKKTPHIGTLTIASPHGFIPEKPHKTSDSDSVNLGSAATHKEKQTLHHPLFVGSVIITDGNLAFSMPQGGRVTLKDWDARLSLDQELKTMFLDIQGLASFNQTEGKVEARGNIKNLLSLTPSFEMDILLTNFPVAPFDEVLSTFYPKAKDLLSLGVGSTINLNATIKESQCFCAIESEKIKVDFLAKEKNNTITLDRMATIELNTSPKFLHSLAQALSIDLSIASPEHLKLEIDTLQVPLAKGAFIIKDASFSCRYTLTNSQIIQGVLHTESLEKKLIFTSKASNFQLDGTAENLLEKKPIYQGSLSLQNFVYQGNALEGAMHFLYNGTLYLTNTQLSIERENPFTVHGFEIYGPIRAEIQSLALPFPLSTNITLDGVFTIGRIDSFENITIKAKAENGSQIKLDILPIQVKKDRLSPYLAKNFPLFILQNDLEAKIQLSDLDLKNEQAVALITFSDAHFVNAKTGENLAIQDIFAKIIVAQPLEIDLQGKANQADFSFKAYLTKTENTLLPYTGNIKGLFNGIDSRIISHWISDSPLFSLFSGSISSTLNIAINPKIVNFALKADSRDNHLDVHCVWDGKTITLNDPKFPLYFDLLITKQNLSDNDLFLVEDSKAIFQISDLSIPYNRFDQLTLENRIKESSFSLSLAIDPLMLKSKESLNLIKAENTLLRLDKRDRSSPVSFSGVSSFITKKGDSPLNVRNGELKWQSTLQLELSENNELDVQRLSIDIDTKIAHMPPEFLELALRLITSTPISASGLFGEMISCQIKAKLQNLSGPVSFQLYSPHAQAYLVANLQKGVLTMDEDMEAQFFLTPELSRILLHIAPQSSINQIMAKSVITCEMKSKGFSCSIYPWIPETFFAPSVHIELGQIVCKNAGNLKTTLGFLKNQKLLGNPRLELWFAPIECHIAKGQLELERTEILLENLYEVCLWGNLDLVKKYADLQLGLTAQCLQSALGVKGLPRNYVLKIPINGPFSNIEVDKSTAMAKIAALLVWQQKDAFGSFGGHLGSFLGQAAGYVLLPDSLDQAPPAKRPFPWENPPLEQKKEKKPSKAFSFLISADDKKPFKQIFKLLF